MTAVAPQITTGGELLRRKDFVDVEDAANAHRNRHLYFRATRATEDIIDECSAKLEANPNDARLHFVRAMHEMRCERYESAVRDFTAFLQAFPSDTTALYTRGVCLDRLGECEGAIEDFSAVLEHDPGHVQAAYARGACQNKRCNFTAAVLDYELALNQDKHAVLRISLHTSERRSRFAASRRKASTSPAGVEAAADTADWASNAPQHLQAAEGSQAAAASEARESKEHDRVTKSPDATPVRAGGQVPDVSALDDTAPRQRVPASPSAISSTPKRRVVGTPTSALRVPDQSVTAETPEVGTAEYHNQQGFLCRKNDDLRGAIKQYTVALQLDPAHFKALFNRGFCFDKLGEYDASIADYTAALKMEPNNAFTYYNLGISYDRKGDAFEKAVEMFTTAIKLDPSCPDFYHNRGFSRREDGAVPRSDWVISRKRSSWTRDTSRPSTTVRSVMTNFKNTNARWTITRKQLRLTNAIPMRTTIEERRMRSWATSPRQ